jgi:hypothetical protein
VAEALIFPLGVTQRITDLVTLEETAEITAVAVEITNWDLEASITRSGTTATVTTTTPHGLTTGQSVSIAGAEQDDYNITATITVVSATVFTYTVAGSPTTPATGLIAVTLNVTGEAVALNDDDNDDDATEWEIYYLWTPVVAGDYGIRMLWTAGEETRPSKTFDRALVWPVTSRLDRYIARVMDLVQETEQGDSQQRLSLRDYRNALKATAEGYSRWNPRQAYQDYTLTSEWLYDLPAGTALLPPAPWKPGFSDMVKIEHPYDETVQGQTFLRLEDWSVDETLSQLRINFSPTADNVLRARFTVPHVLTHRYDTLPSRDFEAICLHAAGWCLRWPLANQAAQTDDPHGQADVVSMRDQQQRRRQQGMEMMREAERRWRVITWAL